MVLPLQRLAVGAGVSVEDTDPRGGAFGMISCFYDVGRAG